MHSIESLLYGNKSKKEIGEKEDPTIFERLSISKRGFYGNSYGPTKLHMKSLEISKNQWNEIEPKINQFINEVNKLGENLEKLGSPKILD